MPSERRANNSNLPPPLSHRGNDVSHEFIDAFDPRNLAIEKQTYIRRQGCEHNALKLVVVDLGEACVVIVREAIR